MPLAKSEMAVERAMSAMAGAQPRGGLGPVLSRRGRLQAPHPGERRSSHPALGIPDQLHALPAGNRPGHAAGPVRVPDPGRGADRHGGRQRLDVRRLDRLRRGDADGPPADQAAQQAVISGGLHPQYADVAATLAHMADDTIVRLPPDVDGERGHRRGDRRRDELRHRPDARLLRQSARSRADRRRGARARRAADRGIHRSGRARRVALAGRNGRRHRGRRGPGARQRAQFRRPLCRPVRDADKERAPDAGPSRRRDCRRRRPAQLRAHPFDARAAHPPREGDEQHLHQFRPVRARLLDPSDAARRDGA